MAERETGALPMLVEPGWMRADCIQSPWHEMYRVLHYADGSARFEHRCDRRDRGVVICAPLLRDHQITEGAGPMRDPRSRPLTITPSVLCPDCGTHGFIRDGRWLDCG